MQVDQNEYELELPEEARLIGTARRIDGLGRVVVPVELRKLMGIGSNELLGFRFVDGHIEIVRLTADCALCGATEGLRQLGKKHICADCERGIREQPECALCGRNDDLIERNGKYVCAGCAREISLV